MKPLLTFLFLFISIFIFGQENLTQKTIQEIVKRNHEQLASLAEAFNEDHYDWRPADEIRSVGESILHVAAANYYLGMKLGYPPPEGIDIMSMESIEGKSKIIETLNVSHDFITDKILMVEPDNLSEVIDLGFGEYSRLATLLIILEHSGEHKGQLIAYARSVGVVPPWSN